MRAMKARAKILGYFVRTLHMTSYCNSTGGGGNCPRFPAFWRADSISRKLLPTCHSSSQHSTVHDKTGVPKTHTITHGQVEAGKGQVRAAGR